MKNFKINLQVMSISILALLGFVIVGLIYYVNSDKISKIEQSLLGSAEAVRLTGELEFDFANMRINELQFLLKRDMKFVKQQQEIVAEALPEIESLRAFYDEPEIFEALDSLKAGFSAYSVQFGEVVNNRQTIGLTQAQGLMGELAATAGRVEDIIEENEARDLDEMLSKMLRASKDFMLTMNPEIVTKMNALKERFIETLSADKNIPDNLKEQVLSNFNTYYRKFTELKDLRIDLVQDQTKLEKIYNDAQDVLDEISADGKEDLESASIELTEISTAAFRFILVSMAAITLVVFGLAVLIGRGIATPIITMTNTMGVLANGNLDVDIPAQDFGNEVGQMARAVQVFKDNAIEIKRLEKEQQATEDERAQERRDLMLKMADDFESSIGGVVSSVSSASTEMQSSASALTDTAEQTSKQATTVAAVSEEAATNVQTVASASEELSSSISEISRQVSQSSQISATAVEEVNGANTQVQGLADAAQKIGEVVALITDIANQTNLLALNATIEAARAGEAGKGFAVVASEVKNLANATANATEEISAQIGGIQGATADAVQAIGSIGGIINQMNEISSTIASAVEEQGAATQEIARNVEQAAAGTNEVSSNITGVQQAASETGQSAAQMLSAAQELSQQSELLSGEVGKFLSNIRSG